MSIQIILCEILIKWITENKQQKPKGKASCLDFNLTESCQ
jgi:hypothetical protein